MICGRIYSDWAISTSFVVFFPPQWLEIYAKKIAELGVFEDRVPNHVLVNEYQPGQGIMVRIHIVDKQSKFKSSSKQVENSSSSLN